MPDILSIIYRRWKFLFFIPLATAALVLLLCLVLPKKYVGTVTALPANAVLADKARIFSQNIEALYSELGSADELDRIEGSAKLDTIYLAASKQYNLVAHYDIAASGNSATEKAAKLLKKNTEVNRTGYGELQIKVWDKSNSMAASLANALLQKLNEIHQHLQTENNRTVLQKLKDEYNSKRQQLNGNPTGIKPDTADVELRNTQTDAIKWSDLRMQLNQYEQLINEYSLAVQTSPKALLVVENARPAFAADKPRTVQMVILSFAAALLFSFLLAVLIESRK